jgi:hypothetical protein
VRPGDVGHVACLAHGAHQQHRGHAIGKIPSKGDNENEPLRVRVEGGGKAGDLGWAYLLWKPPERTRCR